MDKIMITSVIVLAVIAVIEAVSLFYKSSDHTYKPAFTAVIPVFPKDTDLREKLDCLNEKMSDDSCYIGKIIIIDYGATRQQLEMCREFCYENDNAVFADPASVEKILSKTFAIDNKI